MVTRKDGGAAAGTRPAWFRRFATPTGARPVALVLAGIFLTATSLHGQNITGTILGTVTDSSAAVVPQTTVVATHGATNYTRTVVTDAAGNYELPLLPLGAYKITAQAPGFKKFEKTGIVLLLEQKVRVDFVLEVGAVTETVTVQETLPLVDAYTTERNLVIDSKKIVELPLLGRNFTALLRLTPSVVDRSYIGGAEGFPPYTFNGARPYTNRFLLDGANILDSFDGRTVINPSVDAIQEFTVKTNQYSAEYGGGGGIVNATIKSGTNEFHGSAYEFLRNDKLNARPFFAPRRALLRYNQFGGLLGGPVLIPKLYNGKDRTFFLVNYEGIRNPSPSIRLLRVPSALERQGNFSELGFPLYDPITLDGQGQRTPFSGNTIPRSRWNPFVEKLLTFYPEPNMPLNERNQNYVTTRSNTSSTDQLTVRIDQRISGTWNLFGRYSRSVNNAVSPENFPGSGGNLSGVEGHNAVGGLTSVLSPGVISELRFGYTSRNDRLSLPVDKSRNFDKELGFPFADTLKPFDFAFPRTGITNMTGLGGPDTITFGPNQTWYLSEGLTLLRGSHSIKTGFVVDHYNQATQIVFNRQWSFNGNFTALVSGGRFATRGYAFADFLLGFPFQTFHGPVLPGIGREVSLMTVTNYAGYIQDDWKVSRRLTVNLGLRYELNRPPVEDNDRTVVSEITPQGIIHYPKALNIDDRFLTPQIFTPRTVDGVLVQPGKYFGRLDTRQVWDTDKNNFQPRIGFAFRPFGTDNTAIRAAYGIYNGRHVGRLAFTGGLGAPFRIYTETRQDQTIPPGNLRLGELPAVEFTPEGIFTFNVVTRNNPDPFIQQWNFSVQQQLGKDMKVEVAYLGNRADRINVWRIANIRQVPGAREGTGCPAPCPVPRPFTRPFPQFGEDRTRGPWGWSNFHGFELNVERRFSGGLTFTSTFNWNKGIDNGIEALGDNTDGGQPDQQPENPFRSDLDKGRSHDTTGLRWNSSWVFELPFGAGRKFLGSSNRALTAVVSGWDISGILTLQSGFWFHPVNGFVDNSGTGVGRTRPNRARDGNLPEDQRTLNRWFDTAAFQLPPLNTFGTSGRRVLEGPGVIVWDLGIFRRFQIKESHNVQFRAEFFNAPNHPSFSLPDNNLSSSTFGRISGTSTPPRNIQLALKYSF